MRCTTQRGHSRNAFWRRNGLFRSTIFSLYSLGSSQPGPNISLKPVVVDGPCAPRAAIASQSEKRKSAIAERPFLPITVTELTLCTIL